MNDKVHRVIDLPRADRDLLLWLYRHDVLTRLALAEVLAHGIKPGRVASTIMELGLCKLAGGDYSVLERLAKAERADEDDRQRGMDRNLSEQPETD